MLKSYGVWITLLLTLILAGCAVSPTGRSQFAVVPAQQLNQMGAQSFEELKRKKDIARGRQVNNYVRCVADAIIREVGGDWEVVVFDDDTANAFALPGGKIGVHTGLLDVARDQHQLAAVIGHEVGHVLADHSNERMSQQIITRLGLSAAGAALDPQVVQALGIGAQYGILLPYSRAHESEADAIGVDLMARAGFDPRASVALWQNMKAEAGATPPEFMSTHPAPDSRIQLLRADIPAAMGVYEQALAVGKRPRCD